MNELLRIRFTGREAPPGIEVVNDVVMGGVSRARVTPAAEGLVFEGNVSPENGGGFASFRFPVTAPRTATTLAIEALGDGKRYKLVLRGPEDAFQYQAGFTAGDESRSMRFATGEFVARHRGRPVQAPTLALADISWVGLLISERQFGPFRVTLRALSFEGP